MSAEEAVAVPSVRCKFRLDQIRQTNYSGELLHSYELNAVYDGSDENKSFFKWTPTEKLEVGSVRPQAWKLGDEFYIDISLAPKPLPPEDKAAA